MFIRCTCPCFSVFYTQYRVRSSLNILITDWVIVLVSLRKRALREREPSLNRTEYLGICTEYLGICNTFAFVRHVLSFSQTPRQSTYFIRFCLASPWSDVVQILKMLFIYWCCSDIEEQKLKRNWNHVMRRNHGIGHRVIWRNQEIKSWPEIECEVTDINHSIVT